MYGFYHGASAPVKTLFFTSYNPEVGQTDSTPCIAGGTGFNVCDMFKNGERPIALSQDLIDWSIYGEGAPFTKGERVLLKSTDQPDDPRCNGIFVVADALNKRYNGKDRGDLFQLTRATNVSCTANVFKINQ